LVKDISVSAELLILAEADGSFQFVPVQFVSLKFVAVKNGVIPNEAVLQAEFGAMTIGCGSSSNSTTVCRTVYNVVGNWQITVSDTGGGSFTGYGAIDSAGLALFFDNAPLSGSSGDSAELPTLSGNCSFSGNIAAYAEPGGPASGSIATDAAQGNITSSSSISGSFSGNASGTFTLAPFSPLGTSSVTAVSGDKTGVVQGALNGHPVLLPLTFTPSGSDNSMNFTTTNLAGCEANGTFTQQGTNNVFDVSITFTPGCPITGTFSGIGFESLGV
jgi:hypothetical protein